MDFAVPSQVVYDFDGRATVSEVAKSLLAQDRLLREALGVVQELFPDLELSDIQVAVREVSHASPFRSTLMAYVVGVYSTKLGEEMPDVLNSLTGGVIDVTPGHEAFVSLIVLLIAIWVADMVRAKIYPDAAEQVLAMEKARLLQLAANEAAVAQSAMKSAVQTVISKRPGGIRKAALDFLAPAKRHKARGINSGGAGISEEAIKALPSDLDLAQYEPPTEVEELDDVIVRFRAHDLDKERNWAATIEDVSPDRRPLHLAPNVRKESLFERKEVRADVLVTSVRNNDGEYVPSFYFLTKVYDEKPKASA